MKSIIKTLLFGMFWFVAVGVKAQEASGGGYEYLEIQPALSAKFGLGLLVVYSDRTSETVETGLVLGKNTALEFHDAILKEVSKKAKDGWAVTNTTTITLNGQFVPVYFLRKKK